MQEGDPARELLIFDDQLGQAFLLTRHRSDDKKTDSYEVIELKIARAKAMSTSAILKAPLFESETNSHNRNSIALFTQLKKISEENAAADFLDLIDQTNRAFRPIVFDTSLKNNFLYRERDLGFKYGVSTMVAIASWTSMVNYGGGKFRLEIFASPSGILFGFMATGLIIYYKLYPRGVRIWLANYLAEYPTSQRKLFQRGFMVGMGSFACGQVLAKLVSLLP